MLFRGTVDVYCENNTEQTNTLSEQNAELCKLKQCIYIRSYQFGVKVK
jgi:hypothetical protein